MKKATVSGLLGLVFLFGGCKKDSKSTGSNDAPSVVQAAAPAVPTAPTNSASAVVPPSASTVRSSAPATVAPNSEIAVEGIRTGMTLEQVKAVKPDLICAPVKVSEAYNRAGLKWDVTKLMGCASPKWSMEFMLYYGRVYCITWYCLDSVEGCGRVTAQMNTHFGKPRTYRTESIPTQSGSFSEQVMRWRFADEGAMFSFNKYPGPDGGWDDGKLSVANYAFAPPGEDFVHPLSVGPPNH